MIPKLKYALAKQCLLYGALGLLISCSSLPTGQTDQAEPSDNDTLFYVEVSQGGDDFRTTELRKYFQSLGRDFGVLRIKSMSPTQAGEIYSLNRESAGNFRYNSLKVSEQLFYKEIARSVNENFVALEDLVHHDDSEVTGTELMQIIYRQAKALGKEKADLEAIDGRVTVTYAFYKRKLIIVPTTFNFVDGARSTEGTELQSHFGVNAFSKHYLLSLILSDDAMVNMAGKIYIKLEPLDEDSPLDLDHAFTPEGDVDLDHYAFDVTVSNESGTFKPLGSGLPPFAQLLVDRLSLPELHYRALVPAGDPKIEGTVYPTP